MTTRRDPVTSGSLLREKRLLGLGLRLLAGSRGLDRLIANPRLQKPGLALAGYMDYVRSGRVQVIGASESDFLATLSESVADERIAELVTREPPLIVVAKGMEDLASRFSRTCDELAVPLVLSGATTAEVIEGFSTTLEYLLAPREMRHGALLDIFAIGVLIQGRSGSGKSECALELVHRGHRLVADDTVEIFRLRNEVLIGQAPEEIRGLMEVRGLGLISIEQLFGVVAVRDSKPIDLVITLVGEDEQDIDRLGLVTSTTDVLGMSRPALTLPVAPGRSLALLIECAARKYLMGQRGVSDLATEYLLRHDRGLEPR